MSIKRKESINKKLVLQVVFSIILVSAVIITKNTDTRISREFISMTETKLNENLNTENMISTIKKVFADTKRKLTVRDKEESEYSAPVNGEIYKKYGMDSSSDKPYYNHGVDILSNTESVKSVSSGNVIIVGSNEKLLNYIVVENDGKQFIYGKMKEIFVNEGEELSKGDIIGVLNEDNKILHLEVWENGESLNPAKLFSIN